MFVVENQRSGQETWEPILASLVTVHGTCGESCPLTGSPFLCMLDNVHILKIQTPT